MQTVSTSIYISIPFSFWQYVPYVIMTCVVLPTVHASVYIHVHVDYALSSTWSTPRVEVVGFGQTSPRYWLCTAPDVRLYICKRRMRNAQVICVPASALEINCMGHCLYPAHYYKLLPCILPEPRVQFIDPDKSITNQTKFGDCITADPLTR